jgi:prepilin-type processing-associated H-X9-DG protein
MGLEGEAFYGPPSSIANSWSADKANKAGELHYAGAFSLVRLLLVNPTYEKPFSNYLHQLHSGKSHAEAWETSVGALGAQKLEADYRAWLVPPNKTARRRPYPSTSPAPQSARSMSDAEIHVLWARLRDWSDHQARLAAEADIAEAALREPHHIEVSLARALMAMEYGDYAVAEKALTGSGAPPDRRLLNALGWMRLQALARNESPPWPAVGSALHPVAERLEPIAKSAAELDLLARYHRSRGEIAQGLLLERRALSADPTCIPCLVFTGQLLYADGHVEEALATAQRALSTLPDGAPPGPVIQQIAFYRSRLREKQGDKSATPGGAAPASSPQKKVDRNEKLNP